jgi:peptidoglycan hydrolase CwlO-like protein
MVAGIRSELASRRLAAKSAYQFDSASSLAVWLQNELVNAKAQIDELNSEIVVLEEENERLQKELKKREGT